MHAQASCAHHINASSTDLHVDLPGKQKRGREGTEHDYLYSVSFKMHSLGHY